jgi:hypothetical protein
MVKNLPSSTATSFSLPQSGLLCLRAGFGGRIELKDAMELWIEKSDCDDDDQ